MKRILDFKNFLLEKTEFSGCELNESSPPSEQNLSSAMKSLKNYIDKTDNKGGDTALAEKTADSIISETPGFFFVPFFKGIPSICTLEIFLKIFSKKGFTQEHIDPNTVDGIINESKSLLENQFPQMVKDWNQNGGFTGLIDSLGSSDNSGVKDLISPEVISRIEENIKNSKFILGELEKVKKITEAIYKDSLEGLGEGENELLKVLFGGAISDYQIASKMRSRFPKLYKYCSDLIGNDDADLSAGLGSLGF